MFRSAFWADTRWLQRLLKDMRQLAYNIMIANLVLAICRRCCDSQLLTVNSGCHVLVCHGDICHVVENIQHTVGCSFWLNHLTCLHVFLKVGKLQV